MFLASHEASVSYGVRFLLCSCYKYPILYQPIQYQQNIVLLCLLLNLALHNFTKQAYSVKNC